MNTARLAGTLLLLSVTVASCGGAKPKDAAPTPTATPTATPQPAPQPIAQSQRQMHQTATPVEFEQLMALLPEVEGWTRSTPRGEELSMGVSMSRAQAGYERNDSSIDLEITDSAFNQVLLAPLTTYLATTYSERTSEGYRKAAPVNGQPAFETWNNDARRADVIVVVANRFVVQATGHNVDNAQAVRALAGAIDLSRLATLK